MDCSKANISKRKNPLNRCTPKPFKPPSKWRIKNLWPDVRVWTLHLLSWEVTPLFLKPKVERRSYRCTPNLPIISRYWHSKPFFNTVGTSKSANSDQYPTAMQNIGGQSRNVATTFHRNPMFHNCKDTNFFEIPTHWSVNLFLILAFLVHESSQIQSLYLPYFLSW